MKISNTKLDLYEQCPAKFKFRYKDNLKGNFTGSALLYGTAIDAALNFVLESKRDKLEINQDKANEIFIDKMNEWNPEINRLDFFKGDLPNPDAPYDENDPKLWEEIWENLCQRGLNSIDVYIKEVLPEIDEVISVQNAGSIKNEEDDEYVFIVDFIAKMKDGRIVLMDNKTSSAKYPKTKVKKSQQLSLYLENFPDIKHAGYIVLIKNPDKVGCTHQILIDEIPEETTADSYDRLEKALGGIKAEIFEPNLKSCRLYGKTCEYYSKCFYNIDDGLIPAYQKKKDE